MQAINHIVNENGVEKKVIDASIEIIKKPDIDSHNNVEEVYLNGVRGFLKESIKDSLDKFEYLVSKISALYGVKSAEECLVYDGDKVLLFSKTVVDVNEKLIMTSSIYLEYLNSLNLPKEMVTELVANPNVDLDEISNNYNLPEEKVTRLKNIVSYIKSIKGSIEEFKGGLTPLNLEAKTNRFLITDEAQMEYAINIFINQLDLLNPSNKEDIIRDYIRMVYFDALIGNKDRNVNNYGIVRKEDGSYTFAPLFDSATVKMPDVKNENLCQLNEYLMDRDLTIEFLKSRYQNYIEDMLDIKITDEIDSMTQDVLNEGECSTFNRIVLSSLSKDRNVESMKNY